MINGAHAIIYSKDSEADRSFLRDVLKLPHVDVGEGWLIRWAQHIAGKRGRARETSVV